MQEMHREPSPVHFSFSSLENMPVETELIDFLYEWYKKGEKDLKILKEGQVMQR